MSIYNPPYDTVTQDEIAWRVAGFCRADCELVYKPMIVVPGEEPRLVTFLLKLESDEVIIESGPEPYTGHDTALWKYTARAVYRAVDRKRVGDMILQLAKNRPNFFNARNLDNLLVLFARAGSR